MYKLYLWRLHRCIIKSPRLFCTYPSNAKKHNWLGPQLLSYCSLLRLYIVNLHFSVGILRLEEVKRCTDKSTTICDYHCSLILLARMKSHEK